MQGRGRGRRREDGEKPLLCPYLDPGVGRLCHDRCMITDLPRPLYVSKERFTLLLSKRAFYLPNLPKPQPLPTEASLPSLFADKRVPLVKSL